MMLGRLRHMLVVSPHCDDAVFACGRLLDAHPGSIVVTVCAGKPPRDMALTEWDRAAGFERDDDVMGMRRKEDERGLTILSAYPVWLDFCDSQYDLSPSPERIMEALHHVVSATHVTTIVLPLGLFHSDHTLTHEAGLLLRGRHSTLSWFLYADALYRSLPGLMDARLKERASTGLILQPVTFPVNRVTNRKQAAVECYESQLRALSTPGRPGYADTAGEEAYWRIVS